MTSTPLPAGHQCPPTYPVPRLPIIRSGENCLVELTDGLAVQVHTGRGRDLVFAGRGFDQGKPVTQARIHTRWEIALLCGLAELIETGCLLPGYKPEAHKLRISNCLRFRGIELLVPGRTPRLLVAAVLTDRIDRNRPPVWVGRTGRWLSYPLSSKSPGEALLLALPRLSGELV